MDDKLIWLKRLGLCFLPLLLVDLYVQVAASTRMQFYFPIGSAGCIVYAWFVSTHMERVYPHPQRAIGQLCIAFFLFSMSSINEITKLKDKVTKDNVNEYVYSLAVANGKAGIASFMFVLLLVSYLVIRFKPNKILSHKRNIKI